LLLHGRSEAKLERTRALLNGRPGGGRVTTYRADLSSVASARGLVDKILREEPQVDVLINNAGVFAMADLRTDEGLDSRFAVNTLAPYVLACGLAGRLGPQGRIVNLSSAAQAPVSIDALTGRERLSDDQAYAQSKLALTMWTRALAARWDEDDPLPVAVNPGSLLASKMMPMACRARTLASPPISSRVRRCRMKSLMPPGSTSTTTAAGLPTRIPMRSTRPRSRR